jgi:hypothetical protein
VERRKTSQDSFDLSGGIHGNIRRAYCFCKEWGTAKKVDGVDEALSQIATPSKAGEATSGLLLGYWSPLFNLG